MQEYSLYAKEMSAIADISYTHWRGAKTGGAFKESAQHYLKKQQRNLGHQYRLQKKLKQ
jgi:hypothetical protein